MQTDNNIDETVKIERRKVFWAMNVLPWILLVIVLGWISYHFYKQSQALNVNANASANTNTNVTVKVTARDFLLPMSNANYQIVVSYTNVITLTNKVAVTNIITMESTRKAIRTELDNEYANKDAQRIAGWENKKKQAFEEALHAFQVNAVSNDIAEWYCDVNGERSFKWKNGLRSVEDMHVMPIVPARKMPFTLDDVSVARNLNINLELEISKAVVASIEANFVGMNAKGDQALKRKVQNDCVRIIKEIFDGFETYNKGR